MCNFNSNLPPINLIAKNKSNFSSFSKAHSFYISELLNIVFSAVNKY